MPRRPHRRLPLSARMKDGRIYKKSGTSAAGIIYLRCQNSTVCQGTAKIVNNMIQDLNPHSEYCLIDNLAESKARFREALKEALARHWYRLRDLYDSLAAVHPEAAAHISFRSIRSFMKRCRQNLYPPHPHTILEFAERLVDPEYGRNLEYDSGRLSVKLITDEAGDNHVLFYDENFVQTEMRDVNKLFIDGTFRSTPSMQDAYQLVSILGIKFNHGVPFIWVVMSRKTEVAYMAVLRCVRDNVIPNNRIRLTMSDFERALRNAISRTFPVAHSTGCNTHHDRALYQKAKALGLQNLLRDDPIAKSFFTKILALAYLPSHLIEGQYRKLRDELPANVRRRLHRFLTYYNRYWLQTVKPHGFSVYGLGRRTNNILESYNSRLGHKLENHPAPWDFVCKLLKLQSDAKADVQRLRNNCPIGRHARYATIFKQKKLVTAWRELHMRLISVDEFIQKAASLKGDVAQLIARESNGREGGEFELQQTPPAIPLENDPDYDQDLFDNDPPDWLIDNAEAEEIAPANDSTSDSSADEYESNEEELPAAIDEIHPVIHLFNAVPQANRDQQTPPPEDIEQDMGAIEEVDEIRYPRTPSPEVIEQDMGAIEEVDGIRHRQTPPPEEIDVLVPHPHPQQPHPPILIERNINVQTGRRRRRRKRRADRQPAAPAAVPNAEVAVIRRQLKNRKRKAMRLRAKARLVLQAQEAQVADGLREADLQAQIAEMRERVRQQEAFVEAAQAEANRLRELAEANAASASCRVCLLVTATHTFLPCGHRCCCATCAERLWNIEEDDLRRCPLCRTPATQAPLRIWLAA